MKEFINQKCPLNRYGMPFNIERYHQKLIVLMGEYKRELCIKENIHTKDVRNHHRICDAQKHLLQGIGVI